MWHIRCLVRLSATPSNLTDNAQRLRPTPTRRQAQRYTMTSGHSRRCASGCPAVTHALRRAVVAPLLRQRERLRESPTTPRCALRAPRDAEVLEV